jgi:predicted nuclease of predicted toxin-antitoxin system
MTIWLDEHIAPSIAKFISSTFKLSCSHISDVVGNESTDFEIFTAAREINAIILTKDADFVALYSEHGSPPKIIHLQSGNISNKELKELLVQKLLISINEVINNNFTTLL